MDLFCLCVNGLGTCNSVKLANDIAANINKDAIDDDVMKVVRKVIKEIKKDGCYTFAELYQNACRFMDLISKFTYDEDEAVEVSDILCDAVSKLNENDYFIPNDK